MSHAKMNCELYLVIKGHEQATIAINCWSRAANVGTEHETTYHCGTIMIHSTFGNWANTWTACASPFKDFLARAEFDYVFTKFMGHALREFDADAAIKELRADVMRLRREGSLTKDEARDAWEAITDHESELSGSESDFGHGMNALHDYIGHGNPFRGHIADPSEWPRPTRYASGPLGFWRELWPEFLAALAEEKARPTPPPSRLVRENGEVLS